MKSMEALLWILRFHFRSDVFKQQAGICVFCCVESGDLKSHSLIFVCFAGTTIDQGIAYVLMLLALVLTYIIHTADVPMKVWNKNWGCRTDYDSCFLYLEFKLWGYVVAFMFPISLVDSKFGSCSGNLYALCLILTRFFRSTFLLLFLFPNLQKHLHLSY